MFRKLAVVTVLSLASTPLLAAECSTVVDSTDQMTYSTKLINVSKSCKEFTVTLKHVGTLPKNVMGHNLVVTKAADMQGVAMDGLSAGVANDYLKADDARVIAHTKMLGGGESDTIKFDVSKLSEAENYAFFCSYPGHFALMRGDLKLVD